MKVMSPLPDLWARARVSILDACDNSVFFSSGGRLRRPRRKRRRVFLPPATRHTLVPEICLRRLVVESMLICRKSPLIPRHNQRVPLVIQMPPLIEVGVAPSPHTSRVSRLCESMPSGAMPTFGSTNAIRSGCVLDVISASSPV